MLKSKYTQGKRQKKPFVLEASSSTKGEGTGRAETKLIKSR